MLKATGDGIGLERRRFLKSSVVESIRKHKETIPQRLKFELIVQFGVTYMSTLANMSKQLEIILIAYHLWVVATSLNFSAL